MKHFPILITILLTSLSTNAQIYESYKHVPPTVSNSGNVGRSMDIDGNWAVVGAPGEANNGGVTTGVVHIYHRENDEWVYFQKRQPPDVTEDFGLEVAVEGNWMAVTAPSDEDNAPSFGAVYMYKYFSSSWNFQEKLDHPDGVLGSFGTDVDLDDGRLAIGTFHPDSVNYKVFIYSIQNEIWQVESVIVPESIVSNGFGFRVELDADDLVVIAEGELTDDPEAGSFYYFHFEGENWSEQQQVFSPTFSPFNVVAENLTLDSGRLLYRLPANGGESSVEGIVYYYLLDNGMFELQQTIEPPYSQDNLRFGTGADIQGDRMLISMTSGMDELGNTPGSCFEYELIDGQWELQDSLFPLGAWDFETFGTSVHFYEEGCMVGAPGNNEVESGGGAVYFYEDLFVGLSESETPLEFSLYPNPAGDAIQIIMQDQHSIDYQIVDMQGRTVQSGIFDILSSEQILVHHLKSGIYSLIIRAENGIAVQWFVKE